MDCKGCENKELVQGLGERCKITKRFIMSKTKRPKNCPKGEKK